MFEENENIFPAKPVLIDGQVRNKGAKMVFILLVLFLVTINYFSESYILLIELLVVLAFHEFGHYLMMRVYRKKTQSLFFMSFLASLTKSFSPTSSQKKHVIINLMGPVPGILLGCGLFYLALVYPPNVHLIEIALLFMAINMINLVPLDPFDGGRILEVLFFSQSDRAKMIFTLSSSLVMILSGIVTGIYPLVIFGFLMGLKVRGYQKSTHLHEELEEGAVDFKKEYRDLTNKEYWQIRSVFLTNNPRLKEMIPTGYTLWENERLLMEQVRQLLRMEIKSNISIPLKVLIVLGLFVAIALPLFLVYSNADIIDWYIEHAKI